jgi:hypothetical protein
VPNCIRDGENAEPQRLGAEDFYGENAGGADIRTAPRPPANRTPFTITGLL